MQIQINGHVTDLHEAAPALEHGSLGVAFALRAPDTGRLYTFALDVGQLCELAGVLPNFRARYLADAPASGPADSEPAPAAAGQEEGQAGAPAADSGAPTDAEARANNRELERENPADTGADPERPA